MKLPLVGRAGATSAAELAVTDQVVIHELIVDMPGDNVLLQILEYIIRFAG